MILHQFYLNCLAHASYLVGDEASGTAAVIDPQRDIEQYLAFAEQHGLRIAHVILTHFHADFIAGHLELRDRVGARIYLGASGEGRIRVHAAGRWRSRSNSGGVRLQAHRDARPHAGVDLDRGVRSASGATEPHAVLTGDTLFVGDVGRPDLRAALGWSAADLGGAALRLAAHQAADAAGRQPRLSRSRRRLAVRQGDQQGNGVDHRRAAPAELRAPADERERLRRSGHRRSAGRAGLFHLRRGAEQQGAADAGRSARARVEPDDAGASPWRCSEPAGRFSTRAIPGSSPPPISPAASTSAWADSTPPGPARCSATSVRS